MLYGVPYMALRSVCCYMNALLPPRKVQESGLVFVAAGRAYSFVNIGGSATTV